MGSQAPTMPLKDPSSGDGSPGQPASLPSFEPGSGRYQYVAAIGAGGMASVHSLRDLSLLRTVAIKVLDPNLANRPEEVSRFVREAQITAQLDHPNIVPVHELGTDASGNRYFTMKRVEGRTMTEWIAELDHPPASPEELHQLVMAYLKVCDAVGFAHSRGVLHCDLKPDNIMVGSFGQVYVMDWGLALVKAAPQMGKGVALAGAASQAAVTHNIGCGTPAFMAPEQAAGLPLSDATDVFALGALLYSILTGAPPYPHEDNLEAMAAAERCEFTLPRFSPANPVLMRLGQIIERAMKREPERRHRSVIELRDEVEAALRPPVPTLVFAPGSPIIVEGEPGDCAYIVVRGTCVAYRDVDGRRQILNRLTAGSVFGETALLSGGIRTASVQAEDEVVVRVISRQMFNDNVDRNTPFGTVVVAQANRFRTLDAGPGEGPDK